VVKPLTSYEDERGSFTEIFRAEWQLGAVPVQWNVVTSAANVLRGVHVHFQHDDYLLVTQGKMQLALVDIRSESLTTGARHILQLTASPLQAVFIPAGVAHGFHFLEPSTTLYGVSHYWNPQDELGCRWDDPALALPWQVTSPLISERDQAAGSFGAMCQAYDLACRRQ
jgi:dTDP-4-dehydrorhamnose 3,5-epimerase